MSQNLKQKFTPGPWTFDKDRLCLSTKSMKIFDVSTGVEPYRENAALIAAAPELFEALDFALKAFPG